MHTLHTHMRIHIHLVARAVISCGLNFSAGSSVKHTKTLIDIKVCTLLFYHTKSAPRSHDLTLLWVSLLPIPRSFIFYGAWLCFLSLCCFLFSGPKRNGVVWRKVSESLCSEAHLTTDIWSVSYHRHNPGEETTSWGGETPLCRQNSRIVLFPSQAVADRDLVTDREQSNIW